MFGLTRWSPSGSAFQLHRDIDDLFNRFFGETWGQPVTEAASAVPTWLPAIESYAHDGTFGVRVALPGVDPKHVEVSVSENMLTISGERKVGKESKEGSYYRRELGYGRFERTLELPEGVDPAKVQARYTNGMLEVTMPMPLAVVPKKVEIQIEEGQSKAIKAA